MVQALTGTKYITRIMMITRVEAPGAVVLVVGIGYVVYDPASRRDDDVTCYRNFDGKAKNDTAYYII